MALLSESLWHGPPLPGDRELKCDEHSKKCDEFLGENDEVLEGETNLWCWGTQGSTYKERGFSRGCAITVASCICHHSSDTHVLKADEVMVNEINEERVL